VFRRLKIKLVLINLTLICLVLFLVFVGINWYVNKRAEERVFSSLTAMAQNIDRLRNPSPQNERAVLANYFYLLTDKRGQIIEASASAPAGQKALAALVLNAEEAKGKLFADQRPLWYLRVPQGNDTILLFLRDEGDSALLESLTDISLIIGAVSVLLALVISIVLANRALIPVRRAWEKQQVFVADASHELRTPLAVLNTNLEVVMDSPDEVVADQAQWLTNMQHEIARMSALVENLLFLARADAKSDVAPTKIFSVSDLLQTIAVSFQPFFLEKDLIFEQGIQPNVEMRGVESRIRQLIVILLDNAIKNTPQGRIQMTLRIVHDKPRIEIADTGVGIPPEHIQHIFERFYRTDQSRTREQGGAGLGLSIAQSIIHEHKGSVNVQSEVGIGTIFTVIFPK
jgi:two-component system sensor histidine kinase CiaH